MTNQIAVVLGALILAFLGIDLLTQDGRLTLMLARHLADFTEYLSFWR